MTKYSKIYRETGSKEKLCGYRYNYARSILEVVSKWDWRSDDESAGLAEWEVYTSCGLSLENWKDNPQYWVDYMADQMHEEVQAELKYL